MITGYRSILIWGTKAETQGRSLEKKAQRDGVYWFDVRSPVSHLSYTGPAHLPRDGAVHSGHPLAIKKMPLRQAMGQCGRGNYSTEVLLSLAVKLTMKNSQHASLATQQICRELGPRSDYHAVF